MVGEHMRVCIAPGCTYPVYQPLVVLLPVVRVQLRVQVTSRCVRLAYQLLVVVYIRACLRQQATPLMVSADEETHLIGPDI